MTTSARLCRWALLAALALSAATSWAARGREPYAGYVYPAGGQAGATFRVEFGGQNLNGVNAIYCSGGDVQGKIVEYVRPLSKKQLGDVGQHLRLLLRERWLEVLRPGAPKPPPADRSKLEPLPDHPWLRGLDKMSLNELEALRVKLFDPKKQPNSQIAEIVLVDLTVAAQAAPGDRELRLLSPSGLTNPVRFQVGSLPEVAEREPNGRQDPQAPAVSLPVVLNGQVMPGDTDTLRFHARQGQKLVLSLTARKLIPYLADAVPGWFQGVLTLYDTQGKEVAFDDDFRNDPDPVLAYDVPRDGEYVVEVRDSIYRGREDFVYRLTVGEQPFISRFFPLGGHEGAPTAVQVAGWNLPWADMQLDTKPGAGVYRTRSWPAGSWLTNQVTYAVDDLPEAAETEPNDTASGSQKIALPVIVNGRASRAGDADVFRFEGQAGQEIVAEVRARRLGSPLDSLVQLVNAAGKVVASNDDHEDREAGLITHHADSYLTARLPAAGVYYLRLVDAQRHGGEEYAYRLRVSPPRPDFALRVTPSSLCLPPTRIVPVTAFALRRDGFAGEIELALKNAPPGSTLSGGRIPAGQDRVSLTVRIPGPRPQGCTALELEGRAQVGGTPVIHPAVPAEDMMQAFAYQQLVPAQQLLVASGSLGRVAPAIELVGAGPLRLPAGGKADAQVTIGQAMFGTNKLHLELSDPPPGVTLQNVTFGPAGATLTLQADAKAVGAVGNLIVAVSTEVETNRDPKKTSAKMRWPLGYLPAIPFEVVKP